MSLNTKKESQIIEKLMKKIFFTQNKIDDSNM